MSRKKTYATHTFPPDRRLVAVALSLIYNPHPRVVDGRFIPSRRATACACDVLNLTREEVVASIGRRPTHTSFFGTPPSLLPFPLHASRVCLSLSLFAPCGPLLRRWPQFAGRRTQGGTDALSTSRGHPEYARVLPSRDCLVLDSHVLTASLRDVYMLNLFCLQRSSFGNAFVLLSSQRAHIRTYIHTRTHACRASSCIEKKDRGGSDQGKGIIEQFEHLNISIFAALPCVVWVRVHPRASVLSIQVSPLPCKSAHRLNRQNAV